MVLQSWAAGSKIFNQTTDGVNDYYLGIDGTGGFSITPFSNINEMTFNILVNFPSTINSASTGTRLLEIANSTRTSLFGIDVGNFTGGLTNEYLGVFTNIASVVRASGVADGGSITAGWHMISVSVNTLAVVISVDGVNKTITNNATGRPITITGGYTANRIGLMATAAGGVPTGCTWREAALLNNALPIANMTDLYNYYTKDGNIALGISDRTARKYYGAVLGYGSFLALYKGNESGSVIVDTRTPGVRDLVKTNF